MKEAWEWTEDDILSHIHNKIGESTTLDYKACDSLGTSEGKKREISKDISAFANSAGGTIVYGVTENNAHEPEDIDCGFDPSDISGEWLEQVINSNIERRISGVIINTVTLSKTRPGKVLYVVCIPESNLAPHMAADNRFYKRFNFQSVPMKEHEVRNLMRKENYPSRDVVCAWRDDVINPLLYTMTSERQYLKQKNWTLDRWKLHWGLKELSFINDRATYSGNKEQFLEEYPQIKEIIDRHDEAVRNVNDHCGELFSVLKESQALLDIYLKAITPAALQSYKDSYHIDLGNCATDEAILDRMFGSSDNQEAHLACLAEHIVNTTGTLYFSNRTTAPIWNANRDDLLAVLRHPSVSHYWAAAEEAREDLLSCIELIIELVKNLRAELTRQHGVPVEVHQQPLVIYRNSLYEW